MKCVGAARLVLRSTQPDQADKHNHHGDDGRNHHVDDKLCPWRPVEQCWKQIAEQMRHSGKGGLYINAMTLVGPQLVDKNRHSITHFLCAQAGFWDELALDHVPTLGYQFWVRCKTDQLGEGNVAIQAFGDYEPGYDIDMLDKSHQLQIALVAHYAVAASTAWNKEAPRMVPWVIEMAAGARSCFAQNGEGSKEIGEFRDCFPDATDAAGGWSNRIPASIFAESIMGLLSGKTPGILKADGAAGLRPDVEVVQRFGPLVLLHVTCPSALNGGNKYMVFSALLMTKK